MGDVGPGMRDKSGGPAAFARGLYFELQTIEGVKPLEIWSGLREEDSFEKAALIKNLYKIVVPLVNERCFGRPFDQHARVARSVVAAMLHWYTTYPEETLFERFPWPPTGEGDQKELYRLVKGRARLCLEEVDPVQDAGPGPGPGASAVGGADALFDFREMRIVDNELPYIIFTDKEYRVIHGLALVYLWLIGLDDIVLATLEEVGVTREIGEEYRATARRVARDAPFSSAARRAGPQALLLEIQERLATVDYLDLFESVYAWFEQTKSKLLG